jgi:hypothetical protein
MKSMIMNNPQKQLQQFAEFAKSKFVNHREELQTTYQNREVHPNDLLHAYLNHQQILEMELQDKIDELLTKENAHLGPSLNNIKDDYIHKLKAERFDS